MSLLEDVFLQDEAGEAQDLERVIEGDEFEERRRSDDDDEDNNSVRGDDEAGESFFFILNEFPMVRTGREVIKKFLVGTYLL